MATTLSADISRTTPDYVSEQSRLSMAVGCAIRSDPVEYMAFVTNLYSELAMSFS